MAAKSAHQYFLCHPLGPNASSNSGLLESSNAVQQFMCEAGCAGYVAKRLKGVACNVWFFFNAQCCKPASGGGLEQKLRGPRAKA
eukprot:843828-Pelagomonas_calceolata.AAC.5